MENIISWNPLYVDYPDNSYGKIHSVPRPSFTITNPNFMDGFYKNACSRFKINGTFLYDKWWKPYQIYKNKDNDTVVIIDTMWLGYPLQNGQVMLMDYGIGEDYIQDKKEYESVFGQQNVLQNSVYSSSSPSSNNNTYYILGFIAFLIILFIIVKLWLKYQLRMRRGN
jgi:hypothetical protein